MTIRERLKAVAEQRAALALLISRFEAKRAAALAALPQKFGYQSLDEFITAVTQASTPQKRPYRQRKETSAKKAKTKTAATEPAPKQPAPGTSRDAPQQVPLPPTGSDLNDPLNFGALPDVSLLDVPTAADSGYYDHLALALAHARKVLGTSGVSPAVWRAWRSYEQKAGDILRGRHTQAPTDL